LDRAGTYELLSNTVADRGPGFRFALFWSGLWLRSGEGRQGKTWGAQTNPSTAQFKPGLWYHLAATYDGSIFRVYVDGVLAGQSEPNLTLTPGKPSLDLGGYGAGYAYGLNAVVDEVRVYDYPRSEAEIILDAKLAE
jgi:Concanavalin A-like lectin/glucanases superfamily